MSDQNFPRRGFIGGVAAFPLAAIEAAAADTPQAKMKLAVGADHAGFPLKGPMIQLLRSWGHTVHLIHQQQAGRFPGYRPEGMRRDSGGALSARDSGLWHRCGGGDCGQ